jgi:DNA ligase D-like protein (predicted 3'-phosphoesterase)
MELQEYQRKRKFEKTPEPKGKVEITGKNRFVVHDHYAERAGHHHDFRLEMEGVLKSWAVPKLMPEEKGAKRLAISVEDHPLDYFNFTGIIPKGEYGAGEVKIFDKGNYKLIEKDENKIVFELKGKKLKGVYNLIKLRGKKNQWIIFKIKNR